jgi:class 3 adenylate cyclase
VVVGSITKLASYQFDTKVTLSQIALQGVDGSKFTTWRVTATGDDPTKLLKLTPKYRLLPEDASIHEKMEMSLKRSDWMCPFTGLKAPMEIHKNNDNAASVDGIRGSSCCRSSTYEVESKESESHEIFFLKSSNVRSCSSELCPNSPILKLDGIEVQMSKTISSKSSRCIRNGVRNVISESGAFGISFEKLKTLFPFHVIVDEKFIVLQVGKNLPRLLHRRESEELTGIHIGELLEITRPILCADWEWKALRKLADQDFFLRPKQLLSLTEKGSSEDLVKLKGTYVDIEHGRVMFSLSPDARNISDLNKMRLTLTDLPLNGCQRDAILMGEYIVQEVDKAHTLDQLSKCLEYEKNLSNSLLYNMIPKSIANELREGKSVDPTHHENVTLFFSDIVGFTQICDQVDPWEVIALLNQLYSVMDHLATHFRLYKIETIGDAYMCCSGIPTPDSMHAENVINFAIAVLDCVKLIKSPTDGFPIRLRIGIHTGHCTAGVVGTLTPHYCLFGDLVNTTARHEQTSLAGRIQCSQELFDHLKQGTVEGKEQFVMKARGLVNMKGKGSCHTYWIDGATSNNKHTNLSSLKKLSNDVSKMLEKKKWRRTQYFLHSSIQSDSSSESIPEESVQHHPQLRKERCTGSLENCIYDVGFINNSKMEPGVSGRRAKISFSDVRFDVTMGTEDLAFNIYKILSPILNVCLWNESIQQFDDNTPALDKNLLDFITKISSMHSPTNSFHSFRHICNVIHWAELLFGIVEECGSLNFSPWHRLVLGVSALIKDCKHMGVSNQQLVQSNHTICQIFGSKNCQAKYSLQVGLDILTEEFEDLYNRITHGCPTFLHLVRKTVLESSPSSQYDKQTDNPIGNNNQHCVDGSLSLILHVACLCHVARSPDIFIDWFHVTLPESCGYHPHDLEVRECIQQFKGSILHHIDSFVAFVSDTSQTPILTLKQFVMDILCAT